MIIPIDRQNGVPRITENGKIVYSEKSDTLYIRTLITAPNTTKVTASAPYTNTGYITVNIGGTDFNLMVT